MLEAQSIERIRVSFTEPGLLVGKIVFRWIFSAVLYLVRSCYMFEKVLDGLPQCKRSNGGIGDETNSLKQKAKGVKGSLLS